MLRYMSERRSLGMCWFKGILLVFMLIEKAKRNMAMRAMQESRIICAANSEQGEATAEALCILFRWEIIFLTFNLNKPY